MPQTVWFSWKVGPEDSSSGRPLGEVLRRKGVSLRLVRRLKRTGGILVNGQPTRTDYRLQPGDLIELVGDPAERFETGRSETPEIPPVEPEAMPLHILYEDEAILAVAKPAGMLTHPVKRERAGTLANGVAYHLLQELGTQGDELRSQDHKPGTQDADTGRDIIVHPVHRLDRETSGIVLFARNPHAHHRLQEALDKGQVYKEYLALVTVVRRRSDGWLAPPASGTIDWPLARVPGHSSRQQVCVAGRPARTEYRCLEVFPPYLALVAVHPVTGRTHQIRVHLAATGWPILGDPLYGLGEEERTAGAATLPADAGRAKTHTFQRMALHAWRLRFPHPTDRREMILDAPLPDELQHLLEALRSTPR